MTELSTNSGLKIKYWTPLNCLWKLFKTYIANVGYV